MKNSARSLIGTSVTAMILVFVFALGIHAVPFAFAFTMPSLPSVPTCATHPALCLFSNDAAEDAPQEESSASSSSAASEPSDPVDEGDTDPETGGSSSEGSGGEASSSPQGEVTDDADSDTSGSSSSAASSNSSEDSNDAGSSESSENDDADNDEEQIFTIQGPPICMGLVATIYVNEDGYIVGGPDAGDFYKEGDSIEGTDGPDVIVGTDGRNKIRGRGGDDTICAKGGDDEVRGGSGNDKISGGDGNDELEGDAGMDFLYGDAGNDEIEGSTGNDTLCGDEGDDKLEGDSGRDTLDGGSGSDDLDGNSSADVCYAGESYDSCEQTFSEQSSVCVNKYAAEEEEDNGGENEDDGDDEGEDDGGEEDEDDGDEEGEGDGDEEGEGDGDDEGEGEDEGEEGGGDDDSEEDPLPKIRVIRSTGPTSIASRNGGRGSRTRSLFSFGLVHRYINTTAGKNTAPAAYGGKSELPENSVFSIPVTPRPRFRSVSLGTPLIGRERQVLCNIVKVIDKRDDRGAFVLSDPWVLEQIASSFGRSVSDITRALRDPDLCKHFGPSVVGHLDREPEEAPEEEDDLGPMTLFIDEDGYPIVPGDSMRVRVWNNCIRNIPTIRVDPNDPTNIRHYTCAGYRTKSSKWGGYKWEHPEYGFLFGWNYRLGYLVLSEEDADQILVQRLRQVVTAQSGESDLEGTE